MPKITFTQDFDWLVKPGVVIAYKAGRTYPITQACADAATKAGKVKADHLPSQSVPMGIRETPDASR